MTINNDIAIKVENLTKTYKLYNAPIDRLKEAFHWRGKKYYKDFYALNDVSFEVKKGECIGILGKNGAGKSTLLKIITGVAAPSGGSVDINGKISALLELGAGFNPDYTGLENIYFQGTLMGCSKEEMDEKIPAILEFADIGEFIHQPFKSYSSGMGARLAFSVSVNVEPDILIVDEALSVGDMFFQAKSMSKMKQLIENDKTTVLFVSHDIASVKALCGRAVLLDGGHLKMFDSADKVAEEYFAMRFVHDSESVLQQKRIEDANPSENLLQRRKSSNQYDDGEFKKTSNFKRIQNGKASFTNVVILDEKYNQLQHVNFGQTVILRCLVHVCENIHNLQFGFHVRNSNGIDILYDDTVLQGCGALPVNANEEYIVDWKFKVNLQASHFTVAVVCSIPINLEVADVDMCDFIPIAKQFQVVANQDKIYAAMFANSTVRIENIRVSAHYDSSH